MDVHAAAVRTMSRAQWFFISLPMLLRDLYPPPEASRGVVAAQCGIECYRAAGRKCFMISKDMRRQVVVDRHESVQAARGNAVRMRVGEEKRHTIQYHCERRVIWLAQGLIEAASRSCRRRGKRRKSTDRQKRERENLPLGTGQSATRS